MNSPTKWPIRKITAVSIASLSTAIVVILAWLLRHYLALEVPDEVMGAIAIVLIVVIPPLTGYTVKNNPGDFNHRVETPKKAGRKKNGR